MNHGGVVVVDNDAACLGIDQFGAARWGGEVNLKFLLAFRHLIVFDWN